MEQGNCHAFRADLPAVIGTRMTRRTTIVADVVRALIRGHCGRPVPPSCLAFGGAEALVFPTLPLPSGLAPSDLSFDESSEDLSDLSPCATLSLCQFLGACP